MAKNDFQYGGWNYYTLQCGTIMTLISPGDCTLECGMRHGQIGQLLSPIRITVRIQKVTGCTIFELFDVE